MFLSFFFFNLRITLWAWVKYILMAVNRIVFAFNRQNNIFSVFRT